jgi:hypothetical protein
MLIDINVDSLDKFAERHEVMQSVVIGHSPIPFSFEAIP